MLLLESHILSRGILISAVAVAIFFAVIKLRKSDETVKLHEEEKEAQQQKKAADARVKEDAPDLSRESDVRRNEETPKAPVTEQKDNTVQKLLQLIADKNDLNCYGCYAALFSKFARPLQILIGLDAAMASNAENAWLTQDMVFDILQEDVVQEMRDSLRRAGGQIENQKIRLPMPDPENTDAVQAHIRSLSAEEQKRTMHSVQIELQELDTYRQRKKLIEDLTKTYEKLVALAAESSCTWQQIHTLAQESEQILYKNGVFVMHSEDPRLPSAMADRFGVVTERQLVYPGLFVQTEGGYSELGHFSGTRRR